MHDTWFSIKNTKYNLISAPPGVPPDFKHDSVIGIGAFFPPDWSKLGYGFVHDLPGEHAERHFFIFFIKKYLFSKTTVKT